MQRAKDANPDAIYIWVPGGPQPAAIGKSLAERGIDPNKTKVLGQGELTDEDALKSMGDAGARHHHRRPLRLQSSVRARTRRSSPPINAEFKRNPDMFSVGGYDGMHVIYEALKKTGGNTDGEALITAAKGMAWESPRGPMSIDPETRDVVQTVYIRRVEKVGGALVNVEFDKIENVKDPFKARMQVAQPIWGVGMIASAVRRAVRRLRLRHAAVPAVGRAVGDARDDEFRQSRALQLRDARRLRHRDADQQLGLAVSRHPAAGVPGGRGGERRVRARCSTGGSIAPPISTSAC